MTQKKALLAFLIVVVIAGLYLFLDRFIWRSNSTVKINGPVASTQVIHYVPQADALPSAMEDGYCFTDSIAAPYRADAWRCSVGNSINDPCFQISGRQDLLCTPNPTDVSATSTFVLRLTKPLPKAVVPSVAAPRNWGWFVQLSDGTICTPFTGTLPFSAEHDVANYSCNSAMPGESMIFNGLNSSTTPWLAEVGSLSTTGGYPPSLQSSFEIPIQTVWQ